MGWLNGKRSDPIPERSVEKCSHGWGRSRPALVALQVLQDLDL
jgi:hypothetical protein